MNPIFAPKLQHGDEVRIIAPSRSMSIIGQENHKISTERLQELGLKVTFGEHVEEVDDFVSSSIESRVADLHAAFADPNVKVILTVIGGFNSNQLLPYIDWDLIKNNPKIFCGYSDITALNNSIFAKTGLVTYSGPHYSTLGMKKGCEYTLEYFKAALFEGAEIDVKPSTEWSDDAWYLDQENREFIPNKGWHVIQPGTAKGTILGANLSTFSILSATEYMPTADDIILFIEDDSEGQKVHFDRLLTALTQQSWFKNVHGLVIGRFQKASEVSDSDLQQIIASNKALKGLPVISGVDFGHTTPMITIPIGGKARIVASENPSIVFENH